MRVRRINRRQKSSHGSSQLFQCIIVVFGGLMVLLYIVGFGISGKISQGNSINSQEKDDIMARALIQRQMVAQSGEHVALKGFTSCAEAKAKVGRGEWVDPNNGRIYARETISKPQFRISLHDKDYDEVRWRIMEEGKYYEEEVHERFVDILSKEPQAYVLDVGANIGYYTLLSSALGHNVISFEPNPANILRLCDSLRLNDWSQRDVHVFQNAVGNVHGEEMTLHAPRNPGQGFLKPVEQGDEQTDEHKAKTMVVSLDKFAEEQGWFSAKRTGPTIRLLKVDVEGKDPQVFLGASRLLKSGLVQNVLTECRRFGRPVVSEMFAVLVKAGFTLKEPSGIDLKRETAPEEIAKVIADWSLKELGPNSQKNVDMWWVKE